MNLYSKLELREIFCCRFWHRLEDEIKIGVFFEILLPLSADKLCLGIQIELRTIAFGFVIIGPKLEIVEVEWSSF